MSVRASPILFGRNQHRTQQVLILAAVIFFASALFYAATMIGAIPFVWQLMYVPVLIAVGVAAVSAYLNDGLFVSAIITASLSFGWALAGGIAVVSGVSSYGSYFWVGVLFLLLLVLSTVSGVGAFVIGAGMRRVVNYTR